MSTSHLQVFDHFNKTLRHQIHQIREPACVFLYGLPPSKDFDVWLKFSVPFGRYPTIYADAFVIILRVQLVSVFQSLSLIIRDSYGSQTEQAHIRLNGGRDTYTVYHSVQDRV